MFNVSTENLLTEFKKANFSIDPYTNTHVMCSIIGKYLQDTFKDYEAYLKDNDFWKSTNFNYVVLYSFENYRVYNCRDNNSIYKSDKSLKNNELVALGNGLYTNGKLESAIISLKNIKENNKLDINYKDLLREIKVIAVYEEHEIELKESYNNKIGFFIAQDFHILPDLKDDKAYITFNNLDKGGLRYIKINYIKKLNTFNSSTDLIKIEEKRNITVEYLRDVVRYIIHNILNCSPSLDQLIRSIKINDKQPFISNQNLYVTNKSLEFALDYIKRNKINIKNVKACQEIDYTLKVLVNGKEIKKPWGSLDFNKIINVYKSEEDIKNLIIDYLKRNLIYEDFFGLEIKLKLSSNIKNTPVSLNYVQDDK